MRQAKLGDKVRVHYSGFLEDETVFDSSLEKEPFELTIGQHKVIPGLENAIIGMKEGDKKKVSIPPEEAYGHHRKDLVVPVKRSNIPANINPKIGMVLRIRSDDGTSAKATITDITEDMITLDGNHPLAGKRLTFKIKLIDII